MAILSLLFSLEWLHLTPVPAGSCVFLTVSYLQALNSVDSLSLVTLHVEKKEAVSFGFWMGKRLRLESRRCIFFCLPPVFILLSPYRSVFHLRPLSFFPPEKEVKNLAKMASKPLLSECVVAWPFIINGNISTNRKQLFLRSSPHSKRKSKPSATDTFLSLWLIATCFDFCDKPSPGD